MRQVICILSVIVLCLCLFCGCGASEKGAENTAQKIQEEFFTMENAEIIANITADYGETVFKYKLKYRGSSDSGSIEILQPENISGLTAEVSRSLNSVKLSYDGIELDTGSLPETGLTPLDALPQMLSQWESGIFDDVFSEKLNGKDCILITCRISDTVLLKTWFDSITYLPVKADISSDGYTVINCDFENIITE